MTNPVNDIWRQSQTAERNLGVIGAVLVAMFVTSLAGCGGQAPQTSRPVSAQSTATSAEPTPSTRPEATATDSASAAATQSVSIGQQGLDALRARMPNPIGTVPIDFASGWDGREFLDTQQSLKPWPALLAALPSDPSDVSIVLVHGTWVTSDIPHFVQIFAVADPASSASDLARRYQAGLTEGGVKLSVGHLSIGGKSITAVTTAENVQGTLLRATYYLYASGDTLFVVNSSYDAEARAAVNGIR